MPQLDRNVSLHSLHSIGPRWRPLYRSSHSSIPSPIPRHIGQPPPYHSQANPLRPSAFPLLVCTSQIPPSRLNESSSHIIRKYTYSPDRWRRIPNSAILQSPLLGGDSAGGCGENPAPDSGTYMSEICEAPASVNICGPGCR